ncbi:MAG TPA: acetyl-CoA carboxylase biotin carboxylase subunit [Gemmatimonadales bacterium]|nr:acetyl-CoA carboxylase biotin carboxylase subunit [Gemmatimonadales bacterium]
MTSPTIKRVLVANRGEIALRIIRACHEEGLEAVAVYSEADRLSPHVRAADLAVPIGPPPAAESYLDIRKLIAAAQSTACQAVHPGYGFLSERAPFAEAVAAASLEFIGPPAAAIRAMGDKTEARRRMQQAGVPIVPGTTRPLADHVQARPEAARLGYPVLLKASAGGGGKGMRLVREEAELEAGFEAAASEALKAFGAGEVYLEKYLERPRHIEIQILADSFGRVVALGERECSIQRRHQKLIEEAPSVAVTPALRRRMSDAATAAAGAVGYLGAGTIEFLLAPSGEFYFLEMNTRLQVEHPVTELVYGVDIVREQLRVAMGQPLRVHAGTLQPRGHAIECRITAEDPFNDFLPATGVVRHLRAPGGPGVRWDSGIEEGNEVTLYYDPLIAKLIVWGETRGVALERMRRALRELVIVGIPSSQTFHLRVMDDPEFQRGDIDVTYLERAGARLLVSELPATLTRPLAVMAALLAEEQRAAAPPPAPSAPQPARPSAWLLAARREASGQ